MAKAVICPVCSGKGMIREYPELGYATISYHDNICHGCGGKGWVEVASNMSD